MTGAVQLDCKGRLEERSGSRQELELDGDFEREELDRRKDDGDDDNEDGRDPDDECWYAGCRRNPESECPFDEDDYDNGEGKRD